MKVIIVGCGEIGTATAEAYAQLSNSVSLPVTDIMGIDPDPKACSRFIDRVSLMSCRDSRLNIVASTSPVIPPGSDIISICVFQQEAIVERAKEAIRMIGRKEANYVLIESTMGHHAAKCIDLFAEETSKARERVAAFPHRWNPGDPAHGVFNQRRVLGGLGETAGHALLCLLRQTGVDTTLIDLVPWNIAVLSKLTENAHRFMELVLAQELAIACQQAGVDFEQLRAAASTKWNINIYEARDGVGGKCLPKDMSLFREAFPTHGLAMYMHQLNELYKHERIAAKDCQAGAPWCKPWTDKGGA